MTTASPYDPVRPDRLERWGPFFAGIVALLPPLVLHEQFAKLFWFGDDWYLLDQMNQHGLGIWMWQNFAENFVPLFKLLWGWCVHGFHGNYYAMILALWFTHAVTTVLFGRLLRASDFPWSAVLVAQLVFALTPINIETLGWATQWSAILAALFLLWGLDWQVRHQPHTQRTRWRTHAPLVALSMASAFSFSRGVLTGAVLAFVSFWPGPVGAGFDWRRRCWNAGLCLLPPVIATLMIIFFSTGNHQHLSGHFGDAALYGLWYFGLNPFHLLLRIDSWGPRTLTLLTLFKLALVIWGLRHSSGRQRTLLVMLLVFDLGNSALLGIGRYHMGLGTTNSSRYQYGALLCMLPFAGLWIEAQWRRLPSRWPWRPVVGAAALAIMGWFVVQRWPEEISVWKDWRGLDARRILFQDPSPPPMGAIPGIGFMPTDRAKELIQDYHLH